MPKIQTDSMYGSSNTTDDKYKAQQEKRDYLQNILKDLTLEEKVEFLITHYINSHI